MLTLFTCIVLQNVWNFTIHIFKGCFLEISCFLALTVHTLNFPVLFQSIFWRFFQRCHLWEICSYVIHCLIYIGEIDWVMAVDSIFLFMEWEKEISKVDSVKTLDSNLSTKWNNNLESRLYPMFRFQFCK